MRMTVFWADALKVYSFLYELLEQFHFALSQRLKLGPVRSKLLILKLA